MTDSTDIQGERKFVVTEVVEIERPSGIKSGQWFRYTIGHGSAPITGAFICGSTGESHSLSVAERVSIAQRWSQVSITSAA